MRLNSRLNNRPGLEPEHDPREERGGGEVIDLATRTVLPQVTQRKRHDGFGLAAGMVIVAALGALTLWSMDAARNGDQRKLPAPVQPPPQTALIAPQPIPQAPLAAPIAMPPPAPQPVLSQPPQAAVGIAPAVNPAANPTIVFDASALPAPVPGSPAAGAGSGNTNDDFAARLGAGGGTKATARSDFDPRTTVTQGTLIPAVLETAIDTDVPGYVRAIVSTDVRSFDGSRVLVPRSSRLIGQYKSGLQAGQKRAYVIWTRLIRPDGIAVDLASPAIAFGGETGLAGDVNSHFFARFGSALLLSVVGGLSSLGGGNAGVIVAGGGQSAAAAAVTQNGQVGPTIRVRQGEPIRVFTARDLDFSRAPRV